MSYKGKEKDRFLHEHPDATVEEAWEAGYAACTEGWCKGKR